MSDMQKLIIYIEEEIKYVKKIISDIKKRQIDETFEAKISIIKEATTDYKNILKITEEELESLKLFCDERIIYNLKAYRSFVETNAIDFSNSSKQKLESFCNIVLDKYEKYKSACLGISLSSNKSMESI